VAYARPYVSRRLLTANEIFIELLDGSGDGQQIIWAAELWRICLLPTILPLTAICLLPHMLLLNSHNVCHNLLPTLT